MTRRRTSPPARRPWATLVLPVALLAGSGPLLASEPGRSPIVLAQGAPPPPNDEAQRQQEAAKRKAEAEARQRAEAERARQQQQQQQQQQRQEAERQARERARAEAERAREQQRQNSERARAEAEQRARQQEQQRQNAERARADAERARAEAEQRARQQEERQRQQAERARAEAEQRARAAQVERQQEQQRQGDRARAEAERSEAERKARERARAEAEQQRARAVQTEPPKNAPDRRDGRPEGRPDGRADDRARAEAERSEAERQAREQARAEAEQRTRELRRQFDTGNRRDGSADPRADFRGRDGRDPRGPDDRRDAQARLYPDGPGRRLDDIRRERRQVEEQGRTVIQEPGGRRIFRGDRGPFIRHDEQARLSLFGRDVDTRRGRDDVTITVVRRPDGSEIVSEIGRNGYLLRRYRRYGGREIAIIDNRRWYRPEVPFFAALPFIAPPIIRMPRERYIVDYATATDDDLYEALTAPPVERLDDAYSLEDVRSSPELRDRMRRIDLDDITFDTGSWEIANEELPQLARLARIMNRIIDRRPNEVFMIEGYTDAVGPAEDNLTLSDRRAEAVAVILTDEFGVPPENLVTQGFGEQFLKIPTDGPERLNRRVTIRRITPLLSERRGGGDPDR